MTAFAREILARGKVVAPDGTEYPLISATRPEQCEFLADVIRRIDAKVCLEVGLAFGISALFICEAIAGKTNAKFISIDPFARKKDGFGGMGLAHLEAAGYKDLVEFHEDYSHNVLPRLFAQGVKLDFAYIDSTKVFDVLLVDAYYLSRMLRVGGVLVLDDCQGWPGPRRLARYIAKWPHFRVFDVHGRYAVGGRRRWASKLVAKLPGRERLFNDDTLTPVDQLGVNGQCVVFEKLDRDRRPWDWYADF